MRSDIQEQLREFSTAMVESLPDLDPTSVMDPVLGRVERPVSKPWRPWAAIAGLATVAIVAVPMLLDGGSPVATDPVTSDTTIVTHPTTTQLPVVETPSQSEADALRDGVDPQVAAIPIESRVTRLVEISAPEGTWVLSRVPEGLSDDRFNFGEYGEILLLDTDGQILRAYPKPGFPPDWITVTDDYVYAGHVGDGGLPNSSLARIDRHTLEAVMVGFPNDGVYISGWPNGWYGGSPGHVDRLNGVVGFAPQGMTGTPVTSWIGEVVVDLPGVETLINEIVDWATAPSQLEADALRDGVPPEVAAIALGHRVTRLSELQTEEGLWVLSQVSRDFVREDSDLFHLHEYGELLLLDSAGAILRAFPMEYAPATWMAVEGGYLYAGRTGDGGLPHSTLVRVDRSDHDWVVVMIPTGFDETEWPPTWHSWPDNWYFGEIDDVDRYLEVVGFAQEGMTGESVTSWVGEVLVDLAGVETLIAEMTGR